MQSVIFNNPREVGLVEIPEPEMGTEDVLVDIHFVGLCGSDLSTYRGQMPFIKYPRIPGHEISGTIVKKGDKVPQNILIGDKVMLSPYTNCGICPACQVGRINTCQFNETLGVQRDGALTTQIAISYKKVFSSSILDHEELALVEPLSVGYHAANRGRVSEIDSVLVLGCGTIGMGAIAACACKGATVIAVDIDDMKLDLARELGASYTVNSIKEEIPEKVNALTNGQGVNVSIEAAGLSRLFRLAVDMTAFAGRVVYVGYTKEEVSYDTTMFVRKELTIYGSRNALHVFPSVIKMLEKREKSFKRLISKIYPFDKTGEALQEWDQNTGKITKILIDIKK
jgi:2-desacetyl-2-hydroxyethyl bacteriochlorophyllide A dehydrogenase